MSLSLSSYVFEFRSDSARTMWPWAWVDLESYTSTWNRPVHWCSWRKSNSHSPQPNSNRSCECRRQTMQVLKSESIILSKIFSFCLFFFFFVYEKKKLQTKNITENIEREFFEPEYIVGSLIELTNVIVRVGDFEIANDQIPLDLIVWLFVNDETSRVDACVRDEPRVV